MKFAWIHEHKDQWEIQRLCRVMEVARSGYHAWRARQDTPGSLALRRGQLLEQIRVEQELSRGVYGSPRIHAALLDRGIQVCVNTVAKLMKQAGIRASRSQRFRPMTTESRHAYPPAAGVCALLPASFCLKASMP